MVSNVRQFRVFATVDRDAIIEDLYESGPQEALELIGDLILYFGDPDLLAEARLLLNSIDFVAVEPEAEEEEETDDEPGELGED